MTVETRLRSAMADAVAPTQPDTDRLVTTARRRGMGIRRRRQVLGSVGVAAALALAVLAPTVIAGDRGTNATVASVTVGSVEQAFDASQTDPLSGRATAAALLYAVGLEARGEATELHGTATDRIPDPESYAFFRFTPAGSTSAGQVAVNVQPNFLGDEAKPGDDRQVGPCQPFMTRCTFTTLADGSKLTTYDDRSTYGSGGIRRVASLFRPDGVRIVVSGSNGWDVTERDEKITRDEPVLTTEQLVAIVTQGWWGPRLPSYFTAQGAGLDGFSDQDDRASSATALPTPNG